MLFWLLAMASAAQAGAPTLDIELGSDWAIVEEGPRELRLRHKTTANGVVVVFVATPGGRQVGVSPIHDGRTLELDRRGEILPTFAWPLAGRELTAVRIQGEGPDLLIRLEGPPLSSVSSHPDAPADPVLSWVRMRPRGNTWRFALRGVHRWILPPSQGVVHHGQERAITTSWGLFEVRTHASATRGHSGASTLIWDTTPSIAQAQPYPQTGITWTPIP